MEPLFAFIDGERRHGKDEMINPPRLSRYFSPRKTFALAGIISFFAFSFPLTPSQAATNKIIKQDTSVEPTSKGSVYGQVYDESDGSPIKNALVSIRYNGVFADKGDTVSNTNELGVYHCNALIGRKSDNVDVGRLLTGGWFGLIVGAERNETRRVDISSLHIRVTCNGYKTFEGSVLCSRVEATKYQVWMQPILLAPESAPTVSSATEGWGIVSVKQCFAEPDIVHPGQKTLITALVHYPSMAGASKAQIELYYIFQGKIQKKAMNYLSDNGDGDVKYTVEFSPSGAKKAYVLPLTVHIDKSPLAILSGHDTKHCILQYITTDSEQNLAERRDDVFRHLQRDETVEAQSELKQLASDPLSDMWDDAELAVTSSILHDTATTAYALGEVFKKTPDNNEPEHQLALADYGLALTKNGDGAKAQSAVEAVVNSFQPKDRMKKVQLDLMVALGRAYLQEGKLDQAARISKEITHWQTYQFDLHALHFTDDLNFQLSLSDLQHSPTPRNHQLYARMLLDRGRWEEGIDQLLIAKNQDSSLPGMQADLSYALLHFKKDEARKSVAPLDEALKEAESAVMIPGEKGRMIPTMDFHAWHRLAMLRLQKWLLQLQDNIPSSHNELAECVDTLLMALKTARSGSDINPGGAVPFLGYLSAQVTSIAGFAYPEATDDFIILRCIRSLIEHPNDRLSYLDMGEALLLLDEPVSAAIPINKALTLYPNSTEAKYESGLLAFADGNLNEARKILGEVTKVNPYQPRALIILGKIYAEEGDLSNAAACIAKHERIYGSTDSYSLTNAM